jgi:glutamate synthase domain-containing protein 1
MDHHRRRSPLPVSVPDHDRGACGIGFVARTDGDSRREIVDLALIGLARMRHRQAVAADERTGDGAGLLVPIPRDFFARITRDELGASVDPARLGVVFLFLDREDVGARGLAEAAVDEALRREGIGIIGWRDVPVRDDQLGDRARATAPVFRQAIITAPDPLDPAGAERAAYRARRAAELRCRELGARLTVASWGFATVTYKALVLSDRLPFFFPDLEATDFVSPLAVFHSRFSTNTTPAWARAQPFRMLCHNGEINTDRGNQLRMHARGHLGTDDVDLGS